MSTGLRVLCVVASLFAAAMAWGWWRASTHAALNIRIEDYGLRTDRQLYGNPHGAAIEFFDADKSSLATARSIEPYGYMQAFHPDARIQNCASYDGYAQHDAYARCFAAHSRWAAGWAPRVRFARVTVGDCILNDVPVVAKRSDSEWWLWWVPLPHVGGTPLGYFDIVVAIDSKACKAVSK
jgi:hypothetical protein